MNPTITGEQREALYDQLLDRLSGISDLELAIEEKNFGIADRIGREYMDDLRLLLDDFGLGERGRDELIEMTSPPEVLRRALPRLRRSAEAFAESLGPEVVEAEAMRTRGQLVSEACAAVLDALEETTPESDGASSGMKMSEEKVWPR